MYLPAIICFKSNPLMPMGVWVDNVASLSIHIDPVFGETVWAVLLYITMAVVIMLVVICIVLRITNLQRRIDF